jgi:hypothetical protein
MAGYQAGSKPRPKQGRPDLYQKTPLQLAHARFEAAKSERTSTWDSHYRELAENYLPWKSRFMSSDRNRGQKRGSKIINGIGKKSARILASGMSAGLTSQARPWFNLETFDPDLMEYQPVKEWLELVEQRLSLILARSNFYQTLPSVYLELGVFGTGCFSIMDDYEDIIITQPYTVGEYFLMQDDRRQINGFGREFEITVENVVEWFEYENCSIQVQDQYDRGEYDKWVKVRHLVESNRDGKIDLGMGNDRPFRQLYWEAAAYEKDSTASFLEARGMHEFPIIGSRWDLNSGDIYGNGPGMDGLGDCKQTQVMEKRKLTQLELANKPTMRGPASMKNERSSILPGTLTYEPNESTKRYEPAFQVNTDIRHLTAEIMRKEQDIGEFFYTNLFQALINDERNQRATAREVAEVHEEKLLMLGPVIGRVNYEQNDKAIARVFGLASRAQVIPPPPKEMQGSPVAVKYVSILAQAQRLIDVGTLERTAAFTASMSAAFPYVLDKFDGDIAMDKYQEITGAPVGLIRSKEQVTEIRTKKAQDQEMQNQAVLAQQGVETAKSLSETSTSGGNALSDILGI